VGKPIIVVKSIFAQVYARDAENLALYMQRFIALDAGLIWGIRVSQTIPDIGK